MKILCYKMTHSGDPNEEGIWGGSLCIGEKRWRCHYDAVIGVGGVGDKEFGGLVKWMGLGPRQIGTDSEGNALIAFAHFRDLTARRLVFSKVAPHLAAELTMAGRGVKIHHSKKGQAEAEKLIELVKHSPPSPALTLRGDGDDGAYCNGLSLGRPRNGLLANLPRRRCPKRRLICT